MIDKLFNLLEEQNELLRKLVDNQGIKPEEDHMLTPGEAAKYLKISYDTILAWARQGIIPSSKPGGHRVLFSKKALDEWQAEQESKRTPKTKSNDNQYGKIRKIIAS